MSRNLSKRHIMELVKQHYGGELDTDAILDALNALFQTLAVMVDYGSYVDWENPTGKETSDDGTVTTIYPVITMKDFEYNLGNGGKCVLRMVTRFKRDSIGVGERQRQIAMTFTGMKPSTYYLIPYSSYQTTMKVNITVREVASVLAEVAANHSIVDVDSFTDAIVAGLVNTGVFVETAVEGVACYAWLVSSSGPFVESPGSYIAKSYLNWKKYSVPWNKYFEGTSSAEYTLHLYNNNTKEFVTSTFENTPPALCAVKTLATCPESFIITSEGIPDN